jgi:hypothetical protein
MALFYALIGVVIYAIIGRIITDSLVGQGTVSDDGFEKFLVNMFYPVVLLGILVIKAGDWIYSGICSAFPKKDEKDKKN